MKKYRFKTNINCMGCVTTVSRFLTNKPEIEHWEVETANPDKILTVVTSLEKEGVEQLIENAGFRAEIIR
jgi:copper chaperone